MIEASHQNQAVIITVLSEELEMYKIPAFKSAVSECLDSKPLLVIINLEKVESVDSSGIGAFFYFNKLIKAYGGKMTLVQLTEQVDSILRATQSMGLLAVSDTAESVLTAEAH